MGHCVRTLFWVTSCLWLLPFSAANASTAIGSAGTVQFSATITARSCDVTFDKNTQLTYTTLPPSNFVKGSTLQVLSYAFSVTCNYAGTPQLTVTGNTPYSGNPRVFLDANTAYPADSGNGLGVMVRPATTTAEASSPPTLSSFYRDGMGGKALSQGTAFPLIPLQSASNNTAKQVLWLGLVVPQQADKITYGAFKSTLTLTVTVP